MLFPPEDAKQLGMFYYLTYCVIICHASLYHQLKLQWYLLPEQLFLFLSSSIKVINSLSMVYTFARLKHDILTNLI